MKPQQRTRPRGTQGSMEYGTSMSVSREREREQLLNINYVAHRFGSDRFGFRLPFCIINCIRDKRRVIAIEIINFREPIVSGFNRDLHISHSHSRSEGSARISLTQLGFLSIFVLGKYTQLYLVALYQIPIGIQL